MEETKINYSKCGRVFSDEEINLIINTVRDMYHTSRCKISRYLCEKLNWYNEARKPKDRICREFLITLEKDKLIKLPKSRLSNLFKKKSFDKVEFIEPEKQLTGTLSDFNKPVFKRITNSTEHTFWSYLVDKYHYLGYRNVIGRYIKYIIYINDIPVACIGYTGAALKVKDRDNWIGWDDTTRRNNIKHIANNFRFVIFPWVKIKYLASHILSRNVDILIRDWKAQYNVEIYLLETFVEKNKFLGTCYKAANWKYVGATAGFAKTKKAYTKHCNIKDVYVYPVYRNSLELLKCKQ